MHTDGITAFERRLWDEFHEKPVGFWVRLPDRSLAIVKRVEETEQGKRYKVQGIHRNGRFRALNGISCWYSSSELSLHYMTASVDESKMPKLWFES